jgi:hypothetical protein
MKQAQIKWILILLFFGMTAVTENSLVQSRPVKPVQQESSIYALAGEFRVVFANLLWLRVEKYHHEYMHSHPDWKTNKDALGLLELITKLDPHFIQAYDIGSWMYAGGFNNYAKANRMIEDGIRTNPKSWELQRTAAVIFARQQRYDVALRYAKQSVLNCKEDAFEHRASINLMKAIQKARARQSSNR